MFSVTFFGVLSLFICLVNFIINLSNYKRLLLQSFLICVLGTIFLDIGYVFSFGGFYMEYNYLFTIYFFVCALIYYLHHFKNNKIVNSLKIFIFLILFVLLTYVIYLIAGATYNSASFGTSRDILFLQGDFQQISMNFDIFSVLIRLLIFGFSISVLSSCININSVINYSKKIYIFSLIYIILLLIEFFALNLFKSNYIRDLYFLIFGKTEYSFPTNRYFVFLWSPMGMAREPSNYALTLFYLMVNNLFSFIIFNKGKISLIVLALFSLLSGSFSAFWYIFAILVITLIYWVKHKKINSFILNIKKIIGFSVLILFLVCFSYLISQYGNRINNIINTLLLFNFNSFGNLPISSEIIRFYSIFNNLNYFFRNLLLGTGLGTIYCYSGTVTLLTNLGIGGTTLFIFFYLILMKNSFNAKMLKNKKIFIFVLLLPFLFTGHLGYILYFEKTFFAMCLLFLLLFYKTREIERI